MKNKWIKNTQAEIWSIKYHFLKNTFILKNENCSCVKKIGSQLRFSVKVLYWKEEGGAGAFSIHLTFAEF